MAIQDDFRHTIVLPMVEMIHQTVIAFLQTSEQGTWTVDDSKANTAFHLHFIRGRWGRSFFGLGSNRVPEACDVDNRGEFVPETKPMLLEITIRPSPQDVRISLRHSVFAKNDVPRRDYDDYRVYWNRRVRQEVDSLRDYLRKCYNLDVVPNLESTGG